MFELRGLLQEQLLRQSDINLDQIHLNHYRLPVALPSWVPQAITNAVGLTGTMTASEALASALKNPKLHDSRSLTSAIEMAAVAST